MLPPSRSLATRDGRRAVRGREDRGHSRSNHDSLRATQERGGTRMYHFVRELFLSDFPTRTGISLSDGMRDALLFLLDRLERDAGFTMLRELAYVLATIQWETGGALQPVRERRVSRARAPRDRESQDRYWSTGFYGRGYIQITWRENYERAEKRLRGVTIESNTRRLTIGSGTFTTNPDLLLNREVAYLVCSRGMREGWFTARRLGEFIQDGRAPDYVGARRVVNGVDNAAEIAEIACRYELLLRAASREPPG